MRKAAPARQCEGVTASGYRCRNRTRRPGGWCGRCLPCGVDSLSAARAFSGRLDEALPPPDPMAAKLAGWVEASDGVYRLTSDPDTPQHPCLVAEAQIVETQVVGPPSVGWSVFVAAHPGCPPDLLARLAEESACDDVVWAVASNPSTPPMVLARLPDDPGGWGTRVRVAKNRATPPGTLAELAGDPDPDVAAAARANPGFGAAAAAHAGLLAD